jgi:FSR family fosmidomycin resistance protein-like MFS transporter
MARRPRAVLGTAAATHFLHDGFSDIIYVLLPLWAAEFRLSFAQVGLIRTAYSGGMATFQIPAGFLAERWGERRLLAAGTALTATGFIAVGWVGGFVSLLTILLVAGLGSGVQHPLSSSLVSKAYETGARRVALGTYNFAGDLGKVAVPAAVALLATWIGWRTAALSYGLIGLAAAVVILVVLARLGAGDDPPAASAPETVSRRSSWGIRDTRGFNALAAIGVIDNGTRSAFLTFLPFLLLGKGSSVATVGVALGLVFAGGAVGKFVCGAISDRAGVIRTVVVTEAATTLGILAALVAPLGVTLVLLPALGIALNGTSSVLYGTVADLVTPERRSRAYGLYNTLGVGASSLAPGMYGVLSDYAGVPTTITVIGLGVLITIPLCLRLREPLSGLALAGAADGRGPGK